MKRNEKKNNRRLYFFLIAIFVFIIDRLSKICIVRRFEPGETWPVINNIFHITYVRNPGAAFGILSFRTSFFIIISLLMIAFLVFGEYLFPWWRRFPRLSMALILGGAAGNLFDRIMSGSVVDFLDFRIWPVFNVADMALVAGMILLAYSLIKDNSECRMQNAEFKR